MWRLLYVIMCSGNWGAKEILSSIPPKSLAMSLLQSNSTPQTCPYSPCVSGAQQPMKPICSHPQGVSRDMAELHQLQGSRCGQAETDREFPFSYAPDKPQGCSTIPFFPVLAEAELQQCQYHCRQEATSWDQPEGQIQP